MMYCRKILDYESLALQSSSTKYIGRLETPQFNDLGSSCTHANPPLHPGVCRLTTRLRAVSTRRIILQIR